MLLGNDTLPTSSRAPALPFDPKELSAPSPERERARLARELSAIGWQQNLISGAIIATVGFLTFQGGFVGGAVDVAKLLFWGFGLDLGFEQIVLLGKKVLGS